jgi:hypothetical protein
VNIGGLFATLVSWGTQKRWGGDIDNLLAFRVPLYVALALPTVSLICELLVLVESPWWLIMRGRRDEARKALDYIHSWQKDYDSDAKFAELEYTLEKEAEQAELVSGLQTEIQPLAHFPLHSPNKHRTSTVSEESIGAALSVPSFPR